MSPQDWPVGLMAEVDIDQVWMPVESPVMVLRRPASAELGLSEHWSTLDGEWVYQDFMVPAVRPLPRQERTGGEDDLTPQELAALDQVAAGLQATLATIAALATQLRKVGEQGSVLLQKLRRRQLEGLLRHPDVAYLDAQLDGFYSA